MKRNSNKETQSLPFRPHKWGLQRVQKGHRLVYFPWYSSLHRGAFGFRPWQWTLLRIQNSREYEVEELVVERKPRFLMDEQKTSEKYEKVTFARWPFSWKTIDLSWGRLFVFGSRVDKTYLAKNTGFRQTRTVSFRKLYLFGSEDHNG